VKDDRHGAKETGEERELDDGEEGFRDPERNEIGSKVRVSEVTKQGLGKGEDDHPHHNEGDEDSKQAFSESPDGLDDLFSAHLIVCNVT